MAEVSFANGKTTYIAEDERFLELFKAALSGGEKVKSVKTEKFETRAKVDDAVYEMYGVAKTA